ncbi:glyoxylase-like metal-dependent hydrolase (beta-lactamase superfamily II) [Kineothrix alysoides]|uniref:Glyoxylase-like metal-dependent hydrolase (Beta-lactamase superfamily II) n=1 Tax=Kineothrix alysoides TaxID=1469948 RepID=A0A4R1QXT5_9FIRM|nr:MBL fold metallo-hydrolase [Kineothrix alysoides]TCL57004.1 glyoxylase-like metal-dependent hydrolase (beta-lactamase superfamily II) [Kineothrix alysoides]
MSAIHKISGGNVNCYIIFNGNNAILVDTGREKYKRRVLEACRRFNIRLIVLTHGHMDHCQNAVYLAEALHAPIAISKKDMNLIPDNMKQPLTARGFLGKIILRISAKSFESDTLSEFKPTIYLKEGYDLSEYGINAKVVELAGHTEGSIGVDVDGDKLIVGDALMNMFYPTVSMLYTNREQMLQSAKRIGELGKRKIYFGHGRPIENRIWIKAENLFSGSHLSGKV